MSNTLKELEKRLSKAVQHFWKVRDQQATKQGKGGKKAEDRGSRGAVTGGKQLDGFIKLIYELLVESGLPEATIYCNTRLDKGKNARKVKLARYPPKPNFRDGFVRRRIGTCWLLWISN